MSKLYAMSDIHGCFDVFDQAMRAVDLSEGGSMLLLLGDHVPHYTVYEEPSSFEERAEASLRKVMSLCEAHPGQVVALKGNHELDLVEGARETLWSIDPEVVKWADGLPPFYETERQIFVHAGVEEDAEDLWKWGTDEIMFCCKFPPSTGPFLKDVVAGHVGTSRFHSERGCHDVYWDGFSHYYIDGTTERSGELPVLIYDTQARRYSSRVATKDGVGPENPVLPPAPTEGRDAVACGPLLGATDDSE